MWNRIQAEDPSAQILSAWIAKEELRTLLSTVRLGGDPHLTRHRLHRFLSWCIDSQIPELIGSPGPPGSWVASRSPWNPVSTFPTAAASASRTL